MESDFLSRSSKIADPLSDVLSLLKPRGFMSGGVDAGGKWAFHFAPDPLFRCFAVAQGQCWLSLDGDPTAILLKERDFFALPHQRGFCLASEPGVEPVDIMTAIQAPLQGRVMSWQGGGDCLVLSALFTFAGENASFLLEALPAVVHMRGPSERDALRWYLERLMAILREPQPGGALIGEHLAQLILIEILRLHLASETATKIGWLFALADQQLRSSLVAMHEKPGHRWTLQGLAERAGMSRSAFASRFKEKVGQSAMNYLTRWRMLLAADRLVHSSDSVSTVAFSLGYESESAFGLAFKKSMGTSPRSYGSAQQS